MTVSPFVEFARCCSGHTGRSLASGPGSQVPKVCFLGGARKKFERRSLPWFSNLFWEEPRPRRGRAMRSRRPSAAGRRQGPEAVTEQKTGYITADTLQSEVVICTLAAEVRRNCSPIRAARSTAGRAQFAPVVARRKAHFRRLHRTRGREEKAARIAGL